MRNYIFTDLACERMVEREGDDTVQWLTPEIAMRKIVEKGEPASANQRVYVSFFTPKLWSISDTTFSSLSHGIAKELRLLGQIPDEPDKKISILTVGLGNEALSPDSLGPETINHVMVTRHLYRDERLASFYRGYHRVSAIKPGVLANTGIETMELLKGTILRTQPDLIIAVDALAARNTERLAATIQLSNQGISPGSGIGNHRKAINEKTLGIPVIAIGVPTVIHSTTMIRDVLEQETLPEQQKNMEHLLKKYDGFFVTPKEIDLLIKSASVLLANAIDLACRIGQE